jgi:hypothetical protein
MWLWLVTTHNTIVSLSDKILTLLGLKHTSSSYIPSTLLTLLSLAVV